MKKILIFIVGILGIGLSFCSAGIISWQSSGRGRNNRASANNNDNYLFFSGVDSSSIFINELCFSFYQKGLYDYVGTRLSSFGTHFVYGTGTSNYNYTENFTVNCYDSFSDTEPSSCTGNKYQGYLKLCYNVGSFEIKNTDNFYFAFKINPYNNHNIIYSYDYSYGPYNASYSERTRNYDTFGSTFYYIPFTGFGLALSTTTFNGSVGSRLIGLKFTIPDDPKFKVNYGSTSYEYTLTDNLEIRLNSPVLKDGDNYSYAGSTGINLFYNGGSQFYNKSELYLYTPSWYSANIFNPICL